MLNNVSSPLLRGVARRSVHVIGRPASSLVYGETPITVYEGKEYKGLKEISPQYWDSTLTQTEHSSKVFSLVPFFFESRFTNKSFVLKMEVYPKAEMLGFEILQVSGVQTVYMPITNLIPITKYDYWAASWKFWTKQN